MQIGERASVIELPREPNDATDEVTSSIVVKNQHITRLIWEKHEATKTIESLQQTVFKLTNDLAECIKDHNAIPLCSIISSPTQEELVLYKKKDLHQITAWNDELVVAIEKMRESVAQMETELRGERERLRAEMEKLRKENEALQTENTALKERLSNDVLRKRQVNRIEMATEKARIASRVRLAGRKRLEYLEGTLMEAHDDIYHIQRFDAMIAPQRDVSFVFHLVSNVNYPCEGNDEFFMGVYNHILVNSSVKNRGYRVCSAYNVEVFVFQSATNALEFAKECHEHAVKLPWPERAEAIPYFATISEYGNILFRGPRLHTCIYACTPEAEVNPVNGRVAYFGSAVLTGIEAALHFAAVGEIVVNDTWVELLCRECRLRDGGAKAENAALTSSMATATAHEQGTHTALSKRSVVMDLRNILGKAWDVLNLADKCPIVCSILPLSLKGRRGLQPNVMFPTPKFPEVGGVERHVAIKAVAEAMRDENTLTAKGEATIHAPNGCLNGRVPPEMHPHPQSAAAAYSSEQVLDTAARLLESYALQEEKAKLFSLFCQIESTCAAFEAKTMQSEDRFEVAKRKLLDPSETAYVCTIDISNDMEWKSMLLSAISAEEYELLQQTLRSFVHGAAKQYYGFLMNGNYVDVFTYAFRELEQSLAFVSEVYIRVNRTGTKYSHATQGGGKDVFLMRAGIACGPMSSIYRNMENGMLKCTGPAIRLSATLCDLAQSGDILAMEDIIRTFRAKNENLWDTQYNIVKQAGKFIGEYNSPSIVHSILPKPFAYRRQHLMNIERNHKSNVHKSNSATAAVTVHTNEVSWETAKSFLQQQLERMERCEAALMSSEDAYENSMHVSSALGNPWLVITHARKQEQLSQSKRDITKSLNQTSRLTTTQPCDSLAFLYCSIAGTTTISRELPSNLAKEVYAHYNYLVQRALASCGGFVAKTNSVTAYVAIFHQPYQAMQAALLIQKSLLKTTWPDELKSVSATLFVRDAATGVLLFNGPRAQMALHFSDEYKWKRLQGSGMAVEGALKKGNDCATPFVSSSVAGLTGETSLTGGSIAYSAINLTGLALEELMMLGLHAYGGEVRVSYSFLKAVSKTISGRLLMDQYAMGAALNTSTSALGQNRTKRKEKKATEDARNSNKKPQRCSEGTGSDTTRNNESAYDLAAGAWVSAVPCSLKARIPLLSLHLKGSVVDTATLLREGLRDQEKEAETSTPVAQVDLTSSPDKSTTLMTITENRTLYGTAKKLKGMSTATMLLLPPAIAKRSAWCLDAEASFQPLPSGQCAAWDKTSAVDSSSYAEAERIQHSIETLLNLFSRSISSVEASPIKSKSNKLLEKHSHNELTDPSPSKDATDPHFKLFLQYSSDLVAHLLIAMRIGNKNLDHWLTSMEMSKSLVTIPKSAFGNTLGDIQEQSKDVRDTKFSKPLGNSKYTSLPSIPMVSRSPSVGGRLLAEGGSSVGRRPSYSAAIAQNHKSNEAESPAKQQGKCKEQIYCSSNSYCQALEYLSNSCRHFNLKTAELLSKGSAIPSVPKSKEFSRSYLNKHL